MKLILGTAQFGSRYGIANTHGKIAFKEAEEILKTAQAAGVDMIDTAIAYGDSERMLGQIGVADWHIITKLPPAPTNHINLSDWAYHKIEGSLDRLQIDRLYGLLLHRSEILLREQGEMLYSTLQDLKAQELVSKIGVSIYGPEELDKIVPSFPFDLVQAPLNILDRRIITSGWLSNLHKMGVDVHTRSIFLQGLLLMRAEGRPDQFKRWQSLWMHWDQWQLENKVTALEACLSFVFAHAEIDRVIVGVDNKTHLKEILVAIENAKPLPPMEIFSEDIDLIDPSRWREL